MTFTMKQPRNRAQKTVLTQNRIVAGNKILYDSKRKTLDTVKYYMEAAPTSVVPAKSAIQNQGSYSINQFILENITNMYTINDYRFGSSVEVYHIYRYCQEKLNCFAQCRQNFIKLESNGVKTIKETHGFSMKTIK